MVVITYKMEFIYYSWFYFIILVSLISQGECFKCYFCSYSPDDRNNRTDKCTDGNFQPQSVYSEDCSLGCETFVQYDANDVMEHWRRNCLQAGQELTDNCKTEKSLAWRHVRCTCSADFCNKASKMESPFAFFLSVTLLMLFWRTAL